MKDRQAEPKKKRGRARSSGIYREKVRATEKGVSLGGVKVKGLSSFLVKLKRNKQIRQSEEKKVVEKKKLPPLSIKMGGAEGIEEAIERVKASIARDSFPVFVKEFWETICQEPLIWNWHMEVLCRVAQEVALLSIDRRPKKHDLLINVPPGSSKSTIFSVMLPAWCFARDPTFQAICGSYSFSLSLDLSMKSRDVIQSEKYQRWYGSYVDIRADQSAKQYFKLSAGGWRYATSTGGAITGFHGHLIIIDDPLDPNRAISKPELKAANHWMEETLPTRKVDKRSTPTILIMQRLAQDDPSGKWLEKKKAGKPIYHICLPAELSEHVAPVELRLNYIDGLLDPIRMDKGVLDEAKGNGQYSYACQYDQWPIPMQGGMFKVEEFLSRIITVYPDKIVREVRYWDKAGTDQMKNPNACFTVGVRMALVLGTKFVIRDVVRGQWATDKREDMIRMVANLDGPSVEVWIEQEPGSGGLDSARQTIKNLVGFRAYADRPVGDKATRADPFSVQVNAGNVCLWQGNWNMSFIEELQWFPVGQFKDQVDAASGAFGRLLQIKLKAG